MPTAPRFVPSSARPSSRPPSSASNAFATGWLSISVPAHADLGTASSSATSISGRLGTVEVVDGRAEPGAGWTVTVSGTGFATRDGSAGGTLPASSITYLPGRAEGSGSVALTRRGNLTLSPGGTAYAETAPTGAGRSFASWNPTLTVSLHPGLIAGVYFGTVTHSVS